MVGFTRKKTPLSVILVFSRPLGPRTRHMPCRVSARAKNQIQQPNQAPLGHKLTHRHFHSRVAVLARRYMYWYDGAAVGDVTSRGPVVCVWPRAHTTACARPNHDHAQFGRAHSTHTPRLYRHRRSSHHTAARRRREIGRLCRPTQHARRRQRARARQATRQCPAHRPWRPPRRRDANARRRQRHRGRCTAVAAEVTTAPPLRHSSTAHRARPNPHPTTRTRITRRHAKPPAEQPARRRATQRHDTADRPNRRSRPHHNQRNFRTERTHHARGARVHREQAKPPGSSGAAAIAPDVATPFDPRRPRVPPWPPRQTQRTSMMMTMLTRARRLPPHPTSPRRVMSLSQPLSPPLLVDVHASMRAVRLGK